METRKLTDKVNFREIRILGDDKTHQTAIVTGRPEMLLSSNHPEVDAADDPYPENRLSVTRLMQEACASTAPAEICAGPPSYRRF